MELFKPEKQFESDKIPPAAPLADRMRPQSFEEFVGQEEIIGPDKPLRKIIAAPASGGTGGKLPSLIFWGPPGSGKPPWLS